MNLKGRLYLIANKVPKCEMLADIGTDHAFVPIYLVMEGKCKKGIASDIRKGPVEIARRNINTYGLGDKIETRIGAGLEPIDDENVDVVVISGMGGELIIRILKDDLEKAQRAKTMIIQPMTAISEVRKWLLSNGFSIYDEELIAEGRRIYTVICTKWTGTVEKIDYVHSLIGKKLIEKKDPLLNDYIDQRISKLWKVINGLKDSLHNNDERIRKINELIIKIEKLKI